jgi:hypothetical protein
MSSKSSVDQIWAQLKQKTGTNNITPEVHKILQGGSGSDPSTKIQTYEPSPALQAVLPDPTPSPAIEAADHFDDHYDTLQQDVQRAIIALKDTNASVRRRSLVVIKVHVLLPDFSSLLM